MISFDIILRVTTLLLLGARELYWHVTENKADTEKPKAKHLSKQGLLEYYLYRFMWLIITLQLLGVDILPFTEQVGYQIVGFTLVVVSVCISYFARREIGVNWAHAAEHQIKKKQDLVTTGIYSYIRHPIYTAVLLSVVGSELVAQSYLVVLFFAINAAGIYMLGKREEKILLSHFGKKYEEYMKTSYMFIPGII